MQAKERYEKQVEEICAYSCKLESMVSGRYIKELVALISEMRDMLNHLYVNYKMPYGPMDATTEKEWEAVIEKGKSIHE